MSDEPTLGEVHRLLLRMDREAMQFREHTNGQLKAVNEHLATINGKVYTNTQKIAVMEQAAAPSAELTELMQIARDIKGVTRFGKMVWYVVAFSIPIGVAVYAWAQSKGQ